MTETISYDAAHLTKEQKKTFQKRWIQTMHSNLHVEGLIGKLVLYLISFLKDKQFEQSSPESEGRKSTEPASQGITRTREFRSAACIIPLLMNTPLRALSFFFSYVV